jgi:acyl carrier protein
MDVAMDGVARDVIAIIANKLRNKRELTLSDRLDEIDLDSFAAVEMIFDLEERFDIQIPYNSNDARTEFQTVGDVVNAIKRTLGQS